MREEAPLSLSTLHPPGSGTNRCPGTTDWRQERQRWSLAAGRHRAAAAMAATDEWVWQGANLLLVVTASGVVLVCVCGLCIPLRHKMADQLLQVLDRLHGSALRSLQAGSDMEAPSFAEALARRDARKKVRPIDTAELAHVQHAGHTPAAQLEAGMPADAPPSRPLTAHSLRHLPDGRRRQPAAPTGCHTGARVLEITTAYGRRLGRDFTEQAGEQPVLPPHHRQTCLGCWERQSTVAVMPCAHICACDRCLFWVNCPMCGADATGILRFKPSADPGSRTRGKKSPFLKEGEKLCYHLLLSEGTKSRSLARSGSQTRDSLQVGWADAPSKSKRIEREMQSPRATTPRTELGPTGAGVAAGFISVSAISPQALHQRLNLPGAPDSTSQEPDIEITRQTSAGTTALSPAQALAVLEGAHGGGDTRAQNCHAGQPNLHPS